MSHPHYPHPASHLPLILAAGAMALAAMCVAPSANASGAASDAAAGPGISLQLGSGNRYHRATVNWETAPLWQYRFGNGSRLDLTGEFGVSYWWARDAWRPESVWQFNAIPMLRWWATDKFYVEGGVGATLFSRTTFAGRDFSTAYQFGDHIGLGYQVSPANRIGLRFSHFSNAGIKRPNPGLDVLQLTYTYRY